MAGNDKRDPYADEVASAKALMAEKQYDEQPWGDWAGDAVGNALNTAKAILPTALGGRGEVGITDIARGAYEGAKDAVTFPGDVISGKQPLYDESGRPLESAVGRSFDTVGAVGGASSLVPVPDNSLRVFGGTRSRTADKNALTKAQIMESQAAERDAIWRQAGWGRGAEGRWRYEIPDVGTTVDPAKFQLDLSTATIPSGMKTTLSEYINHPELFDAYPEFKNMVVKGYYEDSDTHGYYMPQFDRGSINPGFTDPYIALNLKNLTTAEAQRDTLLHEIQHAIQQKEGFVPGTNVKSRPLETPNPRHATYMDAVRNDPEMKELQSLFASDEYKAEKAAKAVLFAEYKKIIDSLDAKEATTGVSTKNEYIDATNDYFLKTSGQFPLSKKAAQIGFSLEDRGIPSAEPPEFLDQFGAYWANAGEVEPRNVQNRRDAPREELKERAPWRTQDKNLPYEAQLIDWNNTSWRKGYADGGEVDDDVTDALRISKGGGGAFTKVVKSLFGPSEREGLEALTKAGSGYKGVPGKPDVVRLPRIGEVEAKPLPAIERAAEDYMRRIGRPGEHFIDVFQPIDKDFARRVADAYGEMKHAPTDPEVKRAYDALAQETLDQIEAAKQTGIEFSSIRGDDPYNASPGMGYADLAERGHLYFLPTEQGFGSDVAFDPVNNPLLKHIGPLGDLENATINDAFRVVHDLYGHYGPGNPFFRGQGEERAFNLHNRMYSPDARPAMASETRGQNSWLNFGPYGRYNRKANAAETIYADQKTGIMPPWTYEKADGGAVDDALRIAKDVGGTTTENPQVFLTDAQGRQYDAQGKPIQPVATQEQSNSAATQAAPTPEQVGRRAAEDPATFDAMMQKYAIPDRDVAEYEALQTAVRKQPQEVQQMTHVGAPPMRDIKVDMPLFGGEYNVGQAPYNVAGPLETTAQTAYDLKTAPLYMTPMTAPIAAGLDVAEGVTTGDPLQASLAAFGVPGKYAKAAIIGASNYAMDPAQAEAGPARWFSKAMEIAREIPMNKMTGEQALAMLRKGTSPEEIRWTGADAFLQGKPTVTKEELVDYLNKNRLQLGEVRLGGEKPEAINYLNQVDKDILERYQPKLSAAEAEHKKALDYFHSVFGSEAEESAWKEVTNSKRNLTDLQLAAMNEMKDRVGTYLPTKYQDYSTSGGEGYAETLYTLGNRKKPRVENRNGMWSLVDENGNVMRGPHGGEYTYWSEGDANRAAGSIYRGSGLYQSGHWDQPDVLAHSRSQTLSYDPPGANRPYRVHNVDETQSDWGQAARKTGIYDPQAYNKWERDTKETKEAIRDSSDKLSMRADEIDETLGPKPKSWRGEEFTNYHERRQAAIAADPKIQEMRKQIEDYRLKLMQLDENKPSIRGVPNAPFIGSTEGWTDLAIKKQLDKALDSDADYFSWTPGQAQADRYDLSTHIGSVVYDPYYEKFNAYDPNGKHLVAEDMRDAARIDEYVGKELADKIRDMAKQRKNEFYDGITIEDRPKIGARDTWAIVKDGKPITLYGQKATGFPNKAYAAEFLDDAFGDTLKDNPIKLSGLDLKTGGEGMKGYYDKVYLKRVQDVIKKATGTKPEIEVIEVQTGDGPRKQLGVKLTDEMREKARFSDFNRGGTVTGPHSYGSDDPAVGRALALTREY